MLAIKSILVFGVGSASLFGFSDSAPVESCERSCWPTPLAPVFGTVPSSLKGVLWLRKHPLAQEDWSKDVWLYEVTGDHDNGPRVPVPFTVQVSSAGPSQGYVIVPDNGFKPNTKYSVRVDGGDPKCDSHDFEYEFSDFETSSPLPLPGPGTLGKLIMPEVQMGHVEVASDIKACSVRPRSALAQMQVKLPPVLRPWFRVLMFETLVDGKPWKPEHSANGPDLFGESWNGRSKDMVFVNCETDGDAARVKGLESGPHTVQMRARLEGSPHTYVSDVVSFDISCETTGVVTTGGSLVGIENEEQGSSDTTGTENAPEADQHGNSGTCSMGDMGSPWSVAAFTLMLLIGRSGFSRRRTT